MDKLTIGAVAILAGLILVSALPLSIDSPEICKHRFPIRFHFERN